MLKNGISRQSLFIQYETRTSNYSTATSLMMKARKLKTPGLLFLRRLNNVEIDTEDIIHRHLEILRRIHQSHRVARGVGRMAVAAYSSVK